MVPDRQKVWTDGRTDGRNGWTDGRAHGRRKNYIPPTSSRDNNRLAEAVVLTTHITFLYLKNKKYVKQKVFACIL